MTSEIADFRAEVRDARKADREDRRILFKKVDKITENTGATNVSVAKIEEHLKALNGRVGSLEESQEDLKEEIKDDKAASETRFSNLERWPFVLIILCSIILGLATVYSVLA